MFKNYYTVSVLVERMITNTKIVKISMIREPAPWNQEYKLMHLDLACLMRHGVRHKSAVVPVVISKWLLEFALNWLSQYLIGYGLALNPYYFYHNLTLYLIHIYTYSILSYLKCLVWKRMLQFYYFVKCLHSDLFYCYYNI